MWSVTRDASFGLDWSVLVNERTLFVCVTLDAGGIGASGQSRLFQLKSAVRVVTIAALHRAFQHFVMERQIELMLRFAVTTDAKLRLTLNEQLQIGKAGLLCVGRRDKDV